MSYKVGIFDKTGKKIGTHTCDSNVFGKDPNVFLIHEYIVMYLANQRQSSAHTKTRGEVKCSGKKLYRQKGSGRARVGDAGSPIRRGGGVAMGPRKERNWKKMMPKKMKRLALCGSLSLRAKTGSMSILQYDEKDIKTKYAQDALYALGFKKSVLLVLSKNDAIIEKSFNNIPYVTRTTASMINAYDIMSHENILFIEDALSVLESRLSV